MATWSRPFIRPSYLLPLADLHPEHLERAEEADRVDLGAGPEREVRRVGDGLPEGRVDRDPLARAADLHPRVPVERVLPVAVARVHEAVHRTGGDPEGPRERDEQHGVLRSFSLAGLEDVTRAIVSRAVHLLEPV